MVKNNLTDNKPLPHFFDLLDVLEHESDRGYVLVIADYLDNSLQELINVKANIVNPNGKYFKSDFDRLFNPDGLLGSFSSKIKLAYLFGLIDEKLFKIIDYVRGIRNDFAHTVEKASLDSDSNKDRLDNALEIAYDSKAMKIQRIDKLHPKQRVEFDSKTGKGKLLVLLSHCVGKISNLKHQYTKSQLPAPEPKYPLNSIFYSSK